MSEINRTVAAPPPNPRTLRPAKPLKTAKRRYHQLKLYHEDESGPQSTKKPVVMESYDEIVFSEPSESFFARVQNHPAVVVPRLPPSINLPPAVPIDGVNDKKRGDTKDHPLSQWFLNFSEADELLKLATARQQRMEINCFEVGKPGRSWKTAVDNFRFICQVQAHIAAVRRQLMDGQVQQSKPSLG
ncbi:hypothetical protein Scep_020504 [Stephania cephalantha]|uniref:Uncharacterized protein n=1 Tax=Stephania cephalantha TaxID=152367 RepID=A0AAP0ICX5_9MAGN